MLNWGFEEISGNEMLKVTVEAGREWIRMDAGYLIYWERRERGRRDDVRKWFMFKGELE